ncbi:MAG: Exodeoxyribonuclease V gamma chain [uncultured Friedmanniella sp.]|uniref:RecBCD enzyme subunit RecC n=1 Tax=uncultured Friedmanniella sp. TaxID=335381 RepID=A0A6J4K9W0_9ACTN|nr:MAG: Exodeoxyribonuclease V gamma chain [uncultured Friedmanniella sp.]
MSLQIHRAERADRLVDALGALLADPLPDPFATEVISVPTPGVERWLAQRLAGRLGVGPAGGDGVCAGVDFPPLPRLVERALGTPATQRLEDPWRPQRAVWPLLRVLDQARGEPWAAVLWSYLGDRPGPDPRSAEPVPPEHASGPDLGRRGRRWSTARQLAGLFARYAAARPAMVQAWAAGRDVDGEGRPLDADRAWQAELWRRLEAELDVPSPAERVAAGKAALAADPAVSGLPERVSVFGATRLEPQHVAVLAALAGGRDVHLWLPHPSPDLWTALAGTPVRRDLPRRTEDRSDAAARHRLLAYLGRDVGELQLVLQASGVPLQDHHHAAEPSAAGARPTLLQRLQAGVAANQPPVEPGSRPSLGADDRSVRLHRSHGPDRQVEVLREVLVGLLADDPSLEPRDILVMCPDIETFAPLVAATFGLDTDEATAEHPGHRLRVRLADRSLRQVNPLLSVLSRLVVLAGSRMESAALLDLCATPPVARRFGFTGDDLERLRDLVARSGVRWGLDAGHRASFGMAGFGQNTWSAGLDRLLLGVTMDETGQHFLGTALPLDDVDSADVDLVGRLAELVARLGEVTDRCREPQPLGGWVALFRDALELLTAVPPAETWQVAHAQAELGRLTETAGDDADAVLSLAELSALLAEAFRGRPGRSNFRTGTLTLCTMHPMRSVPHRVVCLLGVDDGVFPRRGRLDGDDVTAVDERVGDPDPRSEDRQLLLDAVLAAQEHLVLVFAGMDPRTGVDIPPAVPVKELMDAVDLEVTADDGRAASAHVTVRHRLQPFDPANFASAGLEPGGRRPFSFDAAALRGARASLRERREPPVVFPRAPLPPLPGDAAVELAELTRFFRHPLRALLRARAAVSLYGEDEPPDPEIPADLDGLQRWVVGERMLALHLQGVGLDSLRAAEWRRGELPPRAFGSRVLDDVTAQVAEVHAAAEPFLDAEPRRVELAGRLGDRPLVGTVTGVHGDDLVQVSYSRLSPRHRLQAWVELLALTAVRPGRPWRAVSVARRGVSVLGPLDSGWAARVLADLVELQQTGLAEPLPFAAKTSAEYALVRFQDRPLAPRMKLLRGVWRDEGDDLYARFFDPPAGGRGPTGLDALLAEPSRPAEERGSLAEPSRFGTLARRVFHPLINNEELR